MKNTTTLAILEAIKKEYAENNTINVTTYKAMLEAIETLKDEINAEANKKAGLSDISKVMSKILKNVAKEQPHNKIMQYANTYKDYTYVLDGHRIAATKTDVKLNMLPEEEKARAFNIGVYFDNYESVCDEKIMLPTKTELKNMIDLKKNEYKLSGGTMRNKRIAYCFDNGLFVNAEYLLDALSCINCEYLMTTKPKKAGQYINPLYFVDDKKIMLVLPIRRTSDLEKGVYII